jgi:hypothetical protein
MTRRKLIKKFVKAGSIIIAGTSTVRHPVEWLASKASPRKFVRAFRVKKYPGSLRTLGDVSQQSKWSG